MTHVHQHGAQCVVVAAGGSRPWPASKSDGSRLITVTAHTYADLFDEELDDIAAALNAIRAARRMRKG